MTMSTTNIWKKFADFCQNRFFFYMWGIESFKEGISYYITNEMSDAYDMQLGPQFKGVHVYVNKEYRGITDQDGELKVSIPRGRLFVEILERRKENG